MRRLFLSLLADKNPKKDLIKVTAILVQLTSCSMASPPSAFLESGEELEKSFPFVSFERFQ